MAKYRRRNQRRAGWWTWLSFLLFAVVLGLLGYSIYKKTSPAKVLKTLVSRPDNETPKLSKKELEEKLRLTERELQAVQEELESCQLQNQFQKGQIQTSSSGLNLRSDPSLSGDILARIPAGSIVDILFYDDRELILEGATGRWCKIEYAGQQGWVWGNYVEQLSAPSK